MLPLGHPDRIQIAFDDHRLVNNAGYHRPAGSGVKIRSLDEKEGWTQFQELGTEDPMAHARHIDGA